MAVRIQFRRGTAAEWTLADPTLAAGELGYETDTSKFKIGDGTNSWVDLEYAGVNDADIQAAVDAVIGGAPGALDTLNELAAALNDDASFANTIVASLSSHTGATTNVHGIANTANLITTTDLNNHISLTTDVHGIANTALLATQSDAANAASSAVANHSADTTDVHGIANTLLLATQTDAANAAASAVSTHSADTTDVHGIANTALLVTQSELSNEISTLDSTKAPLNAPSFTGTVVLPSTTSIGDVSAAEISYLNNVTSSIQTQLDGKLGTSVASTTYAALAGAEFTGNVVLTANTSIGTVSSEELGYLNGITSSVQDQLDDKAPLESPTFTGTVSGVTKTHVGLGNVDNTSDADKPISDATQTALDAKAALAGATFTGDVETIDLTVTGNLVVQGTTTTISASDLSVKDNMIYLNQAGLSTLTNAVGDGTNVVYTTTEAHGYSVGDDVVITGTTPSSFNIASPGSDILAVTSNTFTVASTVTDTYTSGGTARGRVHSNPDLGWAAGRYDTVNGVGYAHAGLFRDATDGVFKFFDGYVPEPDESVFIDTSDNTFALADVAVADLTATNVTANAVVFTDGTQTKQGVPSITAISQKTDSYTLSSLDERDTIIEISKSTATTLTIPANASVAYPVGTTLDIIQTGTGQVTIANAVGVTVNATPGLKLRTQWSSATLLKRGENTWLVYGDLTA